ncbi:MAG: hypothetical protein MUD14_21440 [Hydrococcus sp. Prado102]|jgi:hypothetical protein|nr:hypothetical protein [Hydrococcus sp. Prado102]
MSSPFTNAKEFLDAKGPIYTFANNPTIIYLLLALSLAIAIYFIYASFAMYRKDKSKANDPALMSILLIAGLATSLAGSFKDTQKKQPTTAYRQNIRYEQRVERHNNPAIAFLGLIGSAGAVLGYKMQGRSSRQRRKQRRF